MNLFATPANFSDGTHTPPAIWNGTSYVAVNTPQTLTLNVQPSNGDTIAFTASCLANATQVNITYTDNVSGLTSLLSVTLTTNPTPYSVVLPITGTNYQVIINPGAGCTSDTATLTPVVVPVVVTPCAEMGRVTKAYVSAYQRNRVHQSNLFPQETRCLTADFNGALAPARSIVSAEWSIFNPVILNMTQGEVIGKESSVVVTAQYWGYTSARCIATLDNGEKYTQLFLVNVQNSPFYQGDPNPGTGPYTLVVTPD